MSHPHYRGTYPDNWPAIAWRVKYAAGGRCERCGAESSFRAWLTVHHLDGDRGNNHPANLVALCQSCHLYVQARFDPTSCFLQEALPGLEEDWMRNRRELYRQCQHQMSR